MRPPSPRSRANLRYEEFLRVWRECFEQPALFVSLGRPAETIDVTSMDREYDVRLMGAGLRQVEPFTVSARVAWRWAALSSARTATTEEDLLTEFLGRRSAGDLDTERPWLRVDLSLLAKIHLDATLQLPGSATWGRWGMEVAARLNPLLPPYRGRRGHPAVAMAWRGDPSVELRCGPGGELFLTGVEIAAWQALELSRQWDDSERRADPDRKRPSAI